MLYIVTILTVLIVLARNKRRQQRICDSKRRLNGKTALVTGGTAGMGLEIATDLAARGARVIVACPFLEEGNQAEKTIISTTGNENVKFILLDLSSFKSVRQFAAIIKSESRLDILVNNAGIGNSTEALTADGMNFIMQVNYYGHFLLTILLLPLMKKSGSPADPARIINTTSMLHHFGVYNLTKEQTGKHNFLRRNRFYATSKLCTALFSRELTRTLDSTKVVANTVDPGIVGTGIFYSLGGVAGFLAKVLFLSLFSSPWEGAQTAIHLAVDEEAGKVSGKLFRNCEIAGNSSAISSNETAKQLWDDSVKMVKLSDTEMIEWLAVA